MEGMLLHAYESVLHAERDDRIFLLAIALSTASQNEQKNVSFPG
jgi:hypothetical protein